MSNKELNVFEFDSSGPSTMVQTQQSLETPVLESQNFTENTPSTSNVTIITKKKKSRKKIKKCNIPIKLTNEEHMLFKKIAKLKVKISKRKYRKTKYYVSLKAAQRLSSNMYFSKMMDNFTNPTKMLTMLKFGEHKNAGKKTNFDLKEKFTALTIYKKCPQSYGFLSKIFAFPSPKELRSLPESNSPLISEKMLAILKRVATKKMWGDERLCVLLFDEISIKPHVKKDEITDECLPDRCLVFMIKGLQHKYTLPIAYSFSVGPAKSVELAEKIKKLIHELQGTKFIPVVTICNEKGNYQEALQYLVNETKKDFESRGKVCEQNVFYVNKRYVITLYDPPSLLKSVRNHLLTKNLKHSSEKKDSVAKWEHVVSLYEDCPSYDGERLILCFTENHVIPGKINKIKTKYACQVFSQRKGTFMYHYAGRGKIPKEAQDTAYILVFFNKLFDSVNGREKDQYLKGGGNRFIRPVKSKSVHQKFWKESIEELKSMEFLGSKKEVTTLKNWIWTLEGFDLLTRKLKVQYHMSSIWMRYFNLDKFNNFFFDIRSHGCRRMSSKSSALKTALASWLNGNISIRL